MDGGSLCKSCGAILPLPDMDGHAACLSCGRNHRIATPDPQPAPTPPRSERFDPTGAGDDGVPWTPDLTISVAKVPKRTRTASGLGCLLSVLLLIGGISAAIVVFARSVSTDVKESLDRAFDVDVSRLTLGSGAVLELDAAGADGKVVDGASAVTEVAAVVYDPQENARFVARLPLTQGRDTPDPVWSSDLFPTNVYDASLAQIGNPVLWAARFFPAMRELSGDVGARELLNRYAESICSVPMADDGITLDVDTPAALRALTKPRAEP